MLNLKNLTSKNIIEHMYDENDVTNYEEYTKVCQKLVNYLYSEQFLNACFAEDDYIHLCGLGCYKDDMNEHNIIHKMVDFDSYCGNEGYSYSDVITMTQDSFDLNDDFFIDDGDSIRSACSMLWQDDNYIDLKDILTRIICDPLPFVNEYPSDYYSEELNNIKEEMEKIVNS